MAIPIIRPLVLTFGSPELFMLAILGITFVASLSGEDVLKGLIAGGMGLFLATIGQNRISGVERFTFGQTFLWDGVGLVPITIGFFAIPEIIDLAIQGSSIAREQVGKLGGVMEGVMDTFRHWWLTIRCSAIGTFFAIIPGIGAGTAQWLAYAHAVQSSPGKERFGKGAIEGVLGPGAANNSSLGGGLITTIAFGVPASVMMAILLGAFLIHGIVPGPDMLIPEPKGHLALTFSFVWINVVSNIITVGVCFLFLNQLVKVTQIRGSLLIPFILLLIFLGAWLLLPQFMTRRAAKKVIKIFRSHHALDVNSARSAEQMGLAAKPFFSLARFGTRDWKPRALQLLFEAGVIQATPDNRLYLDEQKLQNTTLVRKR
jgi:TctA family transporter